MRKIKLSQILVFSVLCSLALLLGICTTRLIFGKLLLGDFRGLVLTLATVVFIYIYVIIIYRFFLIIMPLQEGEIAEDSRQEFIYHVYVLFFLIFFHPVVFTGIVPVPLLHLVYLALGMRLGHNTYGPGIILDPLFVEIGDDCIIGLHSLLIPHVIEGRRLAHYRIKIGNNVTIGVHAVIYSGVTIEDGAIVAGGAIVLKGSHIGRNEVWAGVPARKIKDLTSSVNRQ